MQGCKLYKDGRAHTTDVPVQNLLVNQSKKYSQLFSKTISISLVRTMF